MWKQSLGLQLLVTCILIATGTAEPDDYAGVQSEIALPGDLPPPLIISEPGIQQSLPGDSYGPQPFYGPVEPQPLIPYPYHNIPPFGRFNPGWGWNAGLGWNPYAIKQLPFPNFGVNFPGWGWQSPYLG